MKKEITEKEPNPHCRECGERMFSFPVEAGNIKVWHYDSGGGTAYRLATPFNEKGEKNYAEIYQCLNYKKTPWYLFWQDEHHDIFGLFNGEKFYPENL